MGVAVLLSVSKAKHHRYALRVSANKAELSGIEQKNLGTFSKNSGKLATLQFGKDIPWTIARVFFITSELPELRGDHAHIRCNQAFICTLGNVKIICKDGIDEEEFELTTLDRVLLVPAGIWVNLFMSERTSIAVLTDLPYDESDYIRTWEDYEKFRGVS